MNLSDILGIGNGAVGTALVILLFFWMGYMVRGEDND